MYDAYTVKECIYPFQDTCYENLDQQTSFYFTTTPYNPLPTSSPTSFPTPPNHPTFEMRYYGNRECTDEGSFYQNYTVGESCLFTYYGQSKIRYNNYVGAYELWYYSLLKYY